MQGYRDIEPMEDSTEYLQDLNGHNQDVLWERMEEATMPSDAEIECLAEMEMEHMTLQFPKREV